MGDPKRKEQRVTFYRELIKIAKKTIGYARRCVHALRLRKHIAAPDLAVVMQKMIELALQVVEQTDQRVFPAE